MYHQYFDEFITEYFESNYFAQMMAETKALIAPYVERDPTKFCTYEAFETGIDALEQFCLLRAESIRGQLEGVIPATDEAQAEDDSALVDASGLNISDMGSMNNGMGGGMGGPERGGGGFGRGQTESAGEALSDGESPSPEEVPPEAADGEAAPSADSASAEEAAPTSGNQSPSHQSETAQADSITDSTPSASGEAPRQGAAPNQESGQAAIKGGSENARPEFLTDRASKMEEQGGSPGQNTDPRVTSNSAFLLLGASGAVLLAGLLIAALYRKRA